MSEYQYYEFRALDRRLTAEQQRRLRSLSSRAEISATRFTNEYSFGDFRGDPGRLLEEYFDAYLYAANWGTRELAFRLPRALLDADTARRYCDEEYRAWVTETADHVIVRFRWDDDEGDDWIEAQGLLDPLLGARGGAQVEALLVQRFRREARPADTAAASAGRTASGLLAGGEVRRAARKEAEARARREARERRAAEQAGAYDRHVQPGDPAATRLQPHMNGRSVGSAVNDLARELGGALGIAVLSSLLNGVYRAHLQLNGVPAHLAEAARSSLAAATAIGGPVLDPGAPRLRRRPASS